AAVHLVGSPRHDGVGGLPIPETNPGLIFLRLLVRRHRDRPVPRPAVMAAHVQRRWRVEAGGSCRRLRSVAECVQQRELHTGYHDGPPPRSPTPGWVLRRHPPLANEISEMSPAM